VPQKRSRPHEQKGKRQRKAKGLRRPTITVTARDRAAGVWFAKLMALQARLYAPNGCPWDREQTHQSLRKFLVEETYEVLDAMDSGDPRKFASELGDLLLQVIFHSVLAEEAGNFTVSDVIEAIHTKMVRRHPHVFGDVQAGTSAAVLKNWEQIKAEERAAERATEQATERGGESSAGKAAAADESILAGVPRSLPAVLEAYQLTRRASHIGFDWESLAGVLEKLDEEKREVESALPARSSENSSPARLEEEVGDLLFAGVNVARFLGVDPEIALKKANRKFKKRFQWMEAAARENGRRLADLPRARMEELWNQSKMEEKSRTNNKSRKTTAGGE
jgi:tetrapyrrole methylase family protein/MazG family protein